MNCTYHKNLTMKSLLITAAIVGAAAAALIIYMSDSTTGASLKGSDNVEGAAEDAYDTMNAHLGNLEKETERAFNKVF